MRILIFRHAERENSGSTNPPLSTRGFQQALKLSELVLAEKLPKPTKLWVSPRLRSQQTLMPLQNILGIEAQEHAELDERQSSETIDQFQRRIKKFLQVFEGQTGVIYICSHLDWLEEACYLIPSETDLAQEKYQAWSPCQYMDFEMQDGLWTLHEFGSVQL